MKVFTVEFNETTFYTENFDDIMTQFEEQDIEIGDEIVVSCIEMTEEKYLELPEFDGF